MHAQIIQAYYMYRLQTLFCLLLFTLGLATTCMLLRFVNGLIT